jgi:hypothetical protein
MQEVWAAIAAIVLLLVIYGILSSKLKARRQKAAREKMLPFVNETVQVGKRYHVYLSDGRKFQEVELLGTNDPNSGLFALGGWEGMLVLKQQSGKRVFVRQASVRCVEEA